jgi:hypothetical protein
MKKIYAIQSSDIEVDELGRIKIVNTDLKSEITSELKKFETSGLKPSVASNKCDNGSGCTNNASCMPSTLHYEDLIHVANDDFICGKPELLKKRISHKKADDVIIYLEVK